jgi:hypothetical protein
VNGSDACERVEARVFRVTLLGLGNPTVWHFDDAEAALYLAEQVVTSWVSFARASGNPCEHPTWVWEPYFMHPHACWIALGLGRIEVAHVRLGQWPSLPARVTVPS